MVVFFLFLIITSFHLVASPQFDLNHTQWTNYSISSNQPVSKIIQNNSNPLLVLIKNGDVATFSNINLKDETIYSTSWLGEDGYYFNFLPKNSGDVTFEIHPYTDNVKNEEVKIKLIELAASDIKLISALQDQSQASHLRYMQYHGSEDKSQKARSLYQSASDFYKSNNNSILNAIVLTELAFIHTEKEQFNQAIKVFEEASKVWKSTNNKFLALKTDNFKGLALWNNYQLDSALNTFTTVIEHIKLIQDNSRMMNFFKAQILNNIGLIFFEKKDSTNAKTYFTRSLLQYGIVLDTTINREQIINDTHAFPNYTSISTTINNFALIESTLGYQPRAELLWRIVIDIAQNDVDRLLNARAKTNLAITMMEKGNYDEAMLLLNQTIHTFKSLNEYKWLYMAQYQLAQLNLKLGKIHLAEVQFKKNLQLRNFENNPKDVVEINLKLMEIYRLQGKYSKSARIGKNTLKLANQINHKKSIAHVHLNNFFIHKQNNDLVAARLDINLAKASIKDKTYMRLNSELNMYLAELDLMDKKTSQAIHILQIEAKYLKEIWDTNLLNKANNLLAQAHITNSDLDNAKFVILDEINNIENYIQTSNSKQVQLGLSKMLEESLNIYSLIALYMNQTELGFIKTNELINRFNKRQQTISNIDETNTDLLSQIKTKSIALENNYLSDDERSKIQFDMIELKAQIDFSFAALTPQKQPNISFKDIQNQLDDDTLLIQYSLSDAGGISWWISKNKIETHESPNKKKMLNLINLANNEIVNHSLDGKNIDKLSITLLKPLKSFQSIKKIQLVLDEPLNLVPFMALNDPRQVKNTVMAENSKFKRIVSVQSIKSNDSHIIYEKNSISSLIIADPVTSADDARLSSNIQENFDNPFPRLIGSKTEAMNISHLLSSKTMLGFKANKNDVLASDFRDKSILHFATHAFFHPQLPGLSSLVLSKYNEKGENNSSAYLRALEISNLKLNTNLVVLSGCETGMNKYDDSLGLGGLSDSFMQAGSKNLIASLWKVNDRITGKLMTEFYRGYTNGLSIEESLYQAQKLIRDKRRTRHPKFWAGWFLLSQK